MKGICTCPDSVLLDIQLMHNNEAKQTLSASNQVE